MPFLVGPGVDIGDAPVLSPPPASPPPIIQPAPAPAPPTFAQPPPPTAPSSFINPVNLLPGGGRSVTPQPPPAFLNPPPLTPSAPPPASAPAPPQLINQLGDLPGGGRSLAPQPPDSFLKPPRPEDDFTAAEKAALANDPDLSDLPGWELDDPFALQFDALKNPPLKGGAALTAIAQACSDYGVDPLACLANALHEGASGLIGDGGIAFGPFQIHATDGRLPQFAGRPKNSPVVNAWAWSENGLQYAVRSMTQGRPSARGLHGHPAVYAIVYGFERPADKRGAYTTRAAEYDHLASLQDRWAAYVAARLAGPVSGGAVDNKPITPPGEPAPVYVPAGVLTQWRGLLDIFGTSIPAQHEKVKSFGLTLKDVFT